MHQQGFLADQGVQLIDANGDGKADLLVTTETMSGYYPLRFGGLWDRHSLPALRCRTSFNLEDPEVRLVDLDGDGVTMRHPLGSGLERFFSEIRKRDGPEPAGSSAGRWRTSLVDPSPGLGNCGEQNIMQLSGLIAGLAQGA